MSNKYQIEIEFNFNDSYNIAANDEEDAKTEAIFELIERIKNMRTGEFVECMNITVEE